MSRLLKKFKIMWIMPIFILAFLGLGTGILNLSKTNQTNSVEVSAKSNENLNNEKTEKNPLLNDGETQRGISATYEQTGIIYTSNELSLETLNINGILNLNAVWSDNSTTPIEDITGATLHYTGENTSLTEGLNTISVTYDGFSADFNITVTAVSPSGIETTKNESFPETIYNSTTLTTETIKTFLNVVLNYNDGS